MDQIAIVITDSALNDLEDIENYISQDSPAIARKFISKIFDKIDQLGTYPESGKPVPEFKNSTLRELLINKYRIIYQLVGNNKVNIVRIIHGARLLDTDF